MCGRYTVRLPGAEIAEHFDLSPGSAESLAPRYNLAPTERGPVIRPADAAGPDAATGSSDGNARDRELVELRWGLLPFWVDDPADFPTLLNARSETVAEKPSFRAAFRKRRCLVVADGFYEWKRRDGKQPYYFRLVEDRPFAFAGLWERWEDPNDPTGEAIESYTVLVTEPNQLVGEVHDRMPVMLRPGAYERWLDPESAPGGLEDLLDPYPAEEMTAHPVTRRVGDPAFDTPEAIEPLENG